ncbi:MAG: archaeal proteasome endopeptidase complex subunit beta [Desulfurococcales archaeon]|nr:archaeal proteasome endopeptidase complex subunit beta [Desulfurococcales archaeon]
MFDWDELGSRVYRGYAGKAFKGTTTVGLVTREAVVMGADKRATSGMYIAHKNVRKIEPIDNRAALTIAGLVADAQTLADFLRYRSRLYYITTGVPMSIKAMASLLALVLNSTKYYPFIVQLLLGGIDDRPRLYQIELFGDVTEEKYVATGSGSPIAIGVLESGYSEDLSVDQATNLAREAISASIKRDAYTGEGIDIVTITRDGIKSLYFPVR